MALDTEAGVFLPTTDVYDRALLDQIDVNSQDFRDFLVRLYQRTNDIAIVTNIKTSGYYIETEFLNGNLWFENKSLSGITSNTKTPDYRQEFTKVINFGALPNTAAKTAAHGITINSSVTFTHIYATATDTTGFTSLSIPYAHATAANIVRLDRDATNVTITTGANRTNYDTCYVVLKYLKD